jgi:hypothetical protein
MDTSDYFRKVDEVVHNYLAKKRREVVHASFDDPVFSDLVKIANENYKELRGNILSSRGVRELGLARGWTMAERDVDCYSRGEKGREFRAIDIVTKIPTHTGDVTVYGLLNDYKSWARLEFDARLIHSNIKINF